MGGMEMGGMAMGGMALTFGCATGAVNFILFGKII
jgi:hypothetical protein